MKTNIIIAKNWGKVNRTAAKITTGLLFEEYFPMVPRQIMTNEGKVLLFILWREIIHRYACRFTKSI